MANFDSDGNYIRTDWGTGDTITAPKLNKIEESIDIINTNEISNRFSINVRKLGAKGDGITDDSKAIQAALDLARIGENTIVYIPKGVYMISQVLSVFSNTHMLLDEESIIRRMSTSGDNLLANGLKGGSEQYSNIIIEGGVWDMDDSHTTYKGGVHFNFGNCKNITVKNVRFLNNHGNHCLDLAGVENILIENCSFEGMRLNPNGERDFVEAIQVSEFTAEGQPFFGGVFNNKPCKNVTIKGCIFTNSENPNYSYWPVGIGHHGVGPLPDVCENIIIRDCKFYGCTMTGIRSFAYKNTLIDACYFEGCVRGVHITNVGKGESSNYDGNKPSVNTSINNCIFVDTSDTGIWCFGKISAEDVETNKQEGYANNVKIHNCVFKNETPENVNSAISIGYTKNCIIDSCCFDNVYRAIYYSACDDLIVVNNICNSAVREGVYSQYREVDGIQIYNNNVNVMNNIMEGCQYNGISIQFTESFTVSNNIVKDCSLLEATRGGIIVASYSKNGCITGNVLNGSNHAYDISITATCSQVISSNNVCDILEDKQPS